MNPTPVHVVSMLKASHRDRWAYRLDEMYQAFYHGTDGDFPALLGESAEHAFAMALTYVRIGGFLNAMESGDPEIVADARAIVLQGWVRDMLMKKED